MTLEKIRTVTQNKSGRPWPPLQGEWTYPYYARLPENGFRYEVIASIRYDRQTKFQIYARAGVGEYWIVDPHACTIDVFVLRGQAYAPLGSFKSADQLRSEQFAELTFQVQDLCR
jgi:hypothetical protein